MKKENLVKIPFIITIQEDKIYPPRYINTRTIWDFTKGRAISNYEKTYPSLERATCIGIDYSVVDMDSPFLQDRKEATEKALRNNCKILKESYY